ncbi:uncharacterized protein LOC126897337 isoform X2 [Daktulosphaira vitifoliae]|nr:uncharacterized protein LOC126897337 isoform X2 [Daktulosphaira vitifoliae]
MDTDFAADRRDTASESGFLCISGRSSRVSSIGSVHSTASVASAVSRLSAASNYSRASRGSSPHRVILETSFCGPKSPHHFANRQLLVNDDEEDLSEPTVRPKLTDIETQTEPKPKKVHVESIKREIKSDQIKAKVKKSTKIKDTKTREIKSSTMEETPKEKKTKTKSLTKVKIVLDNPKMQKFVPLESLDDDDVEIVQGNAPKHVPVAIPYEQSSRPKNIISGENQIYIPLKGDPNDLGGNPSSLKRLKPFTNPTILNFINRDPATIESSRRIKKPVRSGSPGIREEFQKFIASADDEADGLPIKPVKLRKQLSVDTTKRKSIDQDCSSRSMSPSIFEEFQKFIAEPEDGDVNVVKLESKNRSSAISITSREVQSVVGSGITDSPNLERSLSPSIHEEFQKFMAQPDDEEKGLIHKSLPPSAYKNAIIGSPSLSTSSNIRSISPSIYEEFQKFIVEPEGQDVLLPPPPPRKHDLELHPDDTPRSRSVSPGILEEFQKFINEPDDDLSGRKCDPPPPPRSPQTVNLQAQCSPSIQGQAMNKNIGRSKTDDQVKIVPLKSLDDASPIETVTSSSQDQILRRRSESSNEARPKTGTLEKSKDRKGSSRSLFGSLLHRASSFRVLNKKSPKHKSTSDFRNYIDPKITNVEFKFKQDFAKNDSIIIPLHSPNESPAKMFVSDSELNNTKEDVRKTYEIKPTKPKSNEKQSLVRITNPQMKPPKKFIDLSSSQKIEIVETLTNETVENYNCIKKINKDHFDKNPTSPQYSNNRSPIKSDDTSPDSESAMSSLIITGTEEEKKKLFSHPSSVEEESSWPSIPTTLPQERSVAVPIIPIKSRTADTSTCSLERPTKCNITNVDLSSGLETYAVSAAFEEATIVSGKLQIKLPKLKSSVQIESLTSPTAMEKCTKIGRRRRTRSLNATISSQQYCNRENWVGFDENDSGSYIKQKPPKKITAFPVSLRPRRKSPNTSEEFVSCGCNCHHENWPTVSSRNRTLSDTT